MECALLTFRRVSPLDSVSKWTDLKSEYSVETAAFGKLVTINWVRGRMERETVGRVLTDTLVPSELIAIVKYLEKLQNPPLSRCVL